MKFQYFVTGIGTDVGKTVISAALVEAFEADYWKPVQAGGLENTDTDVVQQLISNKKSHFFKETYRLNTPASPHYAAEVDGVEINLENFALPATSNNLIVEGAGGLFVPLNKDYLIIDLIKKLKLPVVVVASIYLGSINHTLASIDALQKRNIPIAGIIFNGNDVKSSTDYILEYTKVRNLGNFPWAENISKREVAEFAKVVRNLLYKD
jgi:dethiobiotin synthetase